MLPHPKNCKMKEIFKYLMGVCLFLIAFSFQAQILQTQEEIIETYGEPFHSGVTQNGEHFLFYKIPVTTKTSGTYDQRRILFFKNFGDGSEVCYKFKIIEPSSETNYNISSFSNDLVQTADSQWKDYSKGIVYEVKEVKGVCLITAEYDNEVGLVRVYKF